jgi:hypothetical protein
MRRRSRGNDAATYAEVSVWAILGCKAFSLAYAMSHASRLAARGTRYEEECGTMTAARERSSISSSVARRSCPRLIEPSLQAPA